jgi:hypothetical protein
MTIVPSKNISSEAQMAEIIRSAMMEYFFYGRTKFEEKFQFFQEMIDHLDLAIYFEDRPLQRYEYYLNMYQDQSKYANPSGY